jgi:hypothetical protein
VRWQSDAGICTHRPPQALSRWLDAAAVTTPLVAISRALVVAHAMQALQLPSFMSVHWVGVPEALRARRINRHPYLVPHAMQALQLPSQRGIALVSAALLVARCAQRGKVLGAHRVVLGVVDAGRGVTPHQRGSRRIWPAATSSIVRNKNKRYIGKSQSKRPSKGTQRPPHPAYHPWLGG